MADISTEREAYCSNISEKLDFDSQVYGMCTMQAKEESKELLYECAPHCDAAKIEKNLKEILDGCIYDYNKACGHLRELQLSNNSDHKVRVALVPSYFYLNHVVFYDGEMSATGPKGIFVISDKYAVGQGVGLEQGYVLRNDSKTMIGVGTFFALNTASFLGNTSIDLEQHLAALQVFGEQTLFGGLFVPFVFGAGLSSVKATGKPMLINSPTGKQVSAGLDSISADYATILIRGGLGYRFTKKFDLKFGVGGMLLQGRSNFFDSPEEDFFIINKQLLGGAWIALAYWL